jgi:hypothetical protein
MTKTLAALAVLLPVASSAQSLDALRAGAEAAFQAAPAAVIHPDLAAGRRREPVLQAPLVPAPVRPALAPGKEVGRADLAALFTANRRLMNKVFGARALDLGGMTDAAFSKYYLTFTDAKGTILAPLGDLNRLRGNGIDLRIDAATVYNFKVSVNIFSPARGSKLKMTPVQGTRGPSHEVKTGAVLDAVKARSFIFRAGGTEFWLLYDRDVLPDGSGLADTRSFLFIKEDGLSSKAWPLAESALAIDAPATVNLGGTKVSLTRTADAKLVVRESK